MIVICPECQSQYKVSSEIISSEGRTFKCSNCQNTWFHAGLSFKDMLDEQKVSPEPHKESDDIEDRLNDLEKTLEEDLPDESSDGVENLVDDPSGDLPEIGFIEKAIASVEEKGVKKRQEEQYVPKHKEEMQKGKYALSIGLAIALFLFLCGLGVFYKDYLMYKIPSSKKVYSIFKEEKPISGAGIVFDQVSISWNGTKLVVQGQMINLLRQETDIPKLSLKFIGEGEEILDEVRFAVSDKGLEGEDVLSFEHTIQATSDIKSKSVSIGLGFIALQDIVEEN